ncbi:unnamed protein product [Peronospora destructor]|uniref:RWP-RK domain-containing protein n=1 Tax=Peronospora destructor TaxID=86335 RepID=A0AAV0TUU7_9STRA|nr:unnamed protein product [Peronospora destructor]
MATPSNIMSDKEMEASISLLHMMQPSESIANVTSSKGYAKDSENRDVLHDSLMKVVAKQALDELSLPRVAAPKKIQQQGARLTALSREFTLEDLRPHFGRPIVEVAREFGICTTFLKKICRRCGIKRWPHRQIRSLNRTIQMLEQVESVATNSEEKARYNAQIEELKDKQRAVMEDPDANSKLKRLKKYAASKRAADPLSTSAGQDRESFVPMTSDDDAKNLSARAVAVDSASSFLCDQNGEASVSKPKIQLEAIPRSSPLDVEIPSSILSMTPVSASLMMTPMHAATLSQFHLSAKISPSNRKLMLMKTNADAKCRLCSSSIAGSA